MSDKKRLDIDYNHNGDNEGRQKVWSVKRENRQMGQKNNKKYVEMVFNIYKQESIVKMEHIRNKA